MFILLSIDWIFLPKLCPLKCRFLPTFYPEILPLQMSCVIYFRWIPAIIVNVSRCGDGYEYNTAAYTDVV